MDANGEVQCIRAGAAESVGIVIGVDARSGIGGAVPGIVLTGILVVAVVGAVVQGKVECDGAVAGL